MQGAHVRAVDERPSPKAGSPESEGFSDNIDIRWGERFPEVDDFDLVVPSPGVPPHRYRSKARQVWGDIELAGRALDIPIIAVTGTNGKSTTVMLIEAMLRACGIRARAAGNLGTPALSLVEQPLDVGVLEVSSFQLETIDSFRPQIATVLNVSPDHMDRHGGFKEYIEAKQQIFKNQTSTDVAVLNYDDHVVRDYVAKTQARVIFFSQNGPPPQEKGFDSAWIEEDFAVLREGESQIRLSIGGCRFLGPADQDNILAALATVWAMGCKPEKAIEALADFRPLPHRLEHVAQIQGVDFINDSKATNPGAAQRALENTQSPILWIAGGRDKGLSYGELATAAAGRVRVALLIGEAAGQIQSCLEKNTPCEQMNSLDEAVTRAHALAVEGDIVLLAPACASFDQFKNFEARGESFRKTVLQIAEGKKT